MRELGGTPGGLLQNRGRAPRNRVSHSRMCHNAGASLFEEEISSILESLTAAVQV